MIHSVRIRRGNKRFRHGHWAKLAAILCLTVIVAVEGATSAASVRWADGSRPERQALEQSESGAPATKDFTMLRRDLMRRDCVVPDNRSRKPRGRRRGGS